MTFHFNPSLLCSSGLLLLSGIAGTIGYNPTLSDEMLYPFTPPTFTGQRSASETDWHPWSSGSCSLQQGLLLCLFSSCLSNRLVSLCPPCRCVWCQTTVHDDCMDRLADADQCDLGEFRSLIIPPHYLYRVNKLRRRHPDEYSKVLET